MSTLGRRADASALQVLPAAVGSLDASIRHGHATLAAGSALQLPAQVLHLAGSLNAEVMGFLGPASMVLEQAGIHQILITAAPVPADYRDGLAALDGSRPRGLARSVEWLEASPARGRASPWRRWRAARDMLVSTLRRAPQAAVHVHGFVAALVALHARARAGGHGFVYYSPHGSASLGRLRTLGGLLQSMARSAAGTVPFHRVITSCAVEARLLPHARTAPVHLAESPVARAFFVQRRQPTREPLVIAGVLEDGLPAAERVARLAVLLGDEVVRARVRWAGLVGPGTAPLLRAAGIEAAPAGDEALLAAQMGQAWVFVAPVAATRFPLLLAQAMAARVPCVALDSPFNGALLKDGETGYLCRDLEEMLRRTRELVESPALRERMGEAAHAEAARRFDEGLFRQALLLGYGAPPPATATAAVPELRMAAPPWP